MVPKSSEIPPPVAETTRDKKRHILHGLNESAVITSDNPTRTTRQAVNGRKEVLYDQKYHPLDDFTAPARAAAHRRRLGHPEPDNLPELSDDEEATSDSYPDGGDSGADEAPAKSVFTKGTRQSRRVSTQSDKARPLYNFHVHPQDEFLPRYPKLEPPSQKRKIPQEKTGQRKRQKPISQSNAAAVVESARRTVIPDSDDNSQSEDTNSESAHDLPRNSRVTENLTRSEQSPSISIGIGITSRDDAGSDNGVSDNSSLGDAIFKDYDLLNDLESCSDEAELNAGEPQYSNKRENLEANEPFESTQTGRAGSEIATDQFPGHYATDSSGEDSDRDSEEDY